VLHATLKPGYKAPTKETEALTGMQGTMWVDTQTYQWVRVEAHVTHAVDVIGFVARVEPGTFFQLDMMPVSKSLWLPPTLRHEGQRQDPGL